MNSRAKQSASGQQENPGTDPPAVRAGGASKRAQFWFVLLLTATATLLLGYVLAPMAGALFAAIVFAIVLQPVQEWLVARCRGHRTVAATLLTAMLIVLVVAPLVVLGIVLAQQADAGITALKTEVQQRGIEPMIEPLPRPLRSTARELLLVVVPGAETASTPEAGTGSAGGSIASAKNLVTGVLGGLGGLAFDLAVFVVGLLFLLASGRQLLDWLLGIMPLPPADARKLVRELGETTRGVFLATVLTAIAQTVIATIGYLIAGTPYIALVATGTFVIALVPVLGGAFAGFAAGLITLIAGDTGYGVFLMAWSLVLVNLAENLLRPMFAEGRVRLPGSIIFFAMLGGIAMFGAMGIVAGPLIVVFFRSALRLLRQQIAAPHAAT